MTMLGFRCERRAVQSCLLDGEEGAIVVVVGLAHRSLLGVVVVDGRDEVKGPAAYFELSHDATRWRMGSRYSRALEPAVAAALGQPLSRARIEESRRNSRHEAQQSGVRKSCLDADGAVWPARPSSGNRSNRRPVCDIISDVMWSVEVEPEVEDWIDDLEAHRYAATLPHLERLEERGNLLRFPASRALGEGLFELRFDLDRVA